MAALKETGYKININDQSSDIADLTFSWGPQDLGGNQVLTGTGTADNYWFPTIGRGYKNLVIGQVLTIFNRIGRTITIVSGNATVYYNNAKVSSFTIANNRAVMFVYIYGQYFVQISSVVTVG